MSIHHYNVRTALRKLQAENPPPADVVFVVWRAAFWIALAVIVLWVITH